MPYPLPGMNPWLENPIIWRGVHQRLIVTLGDRLTSLLAPRYFVDVETHTYVSRFPEVPMMRRYPDVTIVNMGGVAVSAAPMAEATMPQEIDLPDRETIEEAYLEIQLVPNGEVVTVIELLSHTNKRPGKDRESYLEKREAFLDTDVNFIEIDLLQAWEPMPYTGASTAGHYRIFIRRRTRLRKAYLYSFNVRQPMPVFPLPLLPEDQEPPIDLGSLLQDVYTRARYDLVMDYTSPPVPPLADADSGWVARQFAQAQ